jgi:hypothetical protein
MMRRNIHTLALSAFGGLLLAACNTTLTLDTDNLERLITTGIQEQNATTGVTVSSVTCPDRPILVNDVFECTAVTSAGTYQVRVTQTEPAGNVRWEIIPAG